MSTFRFETLNTFNMSNMSNMSTSRAFRRSALYRGCEHVRLRHIRDLDTVLIVQRTTNRLETVLRSVEMRLC